MRPNAFASSLLGSAQGTPSPQPKGHHRPSPAGALSPGRERWLAPLAQAAPEADSWVRFSLRKASVTKLPLNPLKPVFNAVHRRVGVGPVAQGGVYSLHVPPAPLLSLSLFLSRGQGASRGDGPKQNARL